MLYRWILRPLLYSFSAEVAHRLVMRGLVLVAALPGGCALLSLLSGRPDPALEVEAFGLRFASPVGLAAGLDKDAEAPAAFGAMGFGSVEVGTLTAQPQQGNPTPRLFRLPADRALINRMGFNNRGAADAARRLTGHRRRRTAPILGINIGRTKVVPAEEAIDDYVTSARLLAAHADYMVINVSSPNTPGLRDLQAVEQLRPLLEAVRRALDEEVPGSRVPLLVKIAPDLADEDLDAVADLARSLKLDGIIATNTTTGRQGLVSDAAAVEACGAGGLSGAPLKARALTVLRRLRARLGDDLVLVAVGGIETAEDAWARITAGATLVQVYTSLIYSGPSLPSKIGRGLVERLRASDVSNLSEVIGSAVTRSDG